MKYMLLIYGAENSWNEDERRACMIESMGICDELATQGKYLGSSPLQSVTTAASVRVRDGRTLVTDGPFAETTEQLGGYYMLDLDDLDEAIAIAARLPPATKGTVEIRPLIALDGLPPDRPLPTDGFDGSQTPFLLALLRRRGCLGGCRARGASRGPGEATVLVRRLSDEGRYLSASPLHPAATATCVRVRGGRRLITDGPFAETHEVLGGYYLILAEDRATAIRLAAQHPGARIGTVEVRPLFDMSGVRESS